MLNNSTLSLTRISSLFRWILLLIVVHTVIAQYTAISIFSPHRITNPAVTINNPINDNATAFQNVVFLGALQVRLTASHAVNLTVKAAFEPLSILNSTTS